MLDRVRVAREREAAAIAAAASARAELEAAVCDAVAGGVSQSAVARELGVSRQAVQQIVARAVPAVQRVSDADLDKQIRVIERKWAALVENYAGQFGSSEDDEEDSEL